MYQTYFLSLKGFNLKIIDIFTFQLMGKYFWTVYIENIIINGVPEIQMKNVFLLIK